MQIIFDYKHIIEDLCREILKDQFQAGLSEEELLRNAFGRLQSHERFESTKPQMQEIENLRSKIAELEWKLEAKKEESEGKEET